MRSCILADAMILPLITTREMREKAAEKVITTTEISGEEVVDTSGTWDAKIDASLHTLHKTKGQVREDNLVAEGENAVFTSGIFHTK